MGDAPMTKDQLTKIITEVLGERCPEHHEQCMTCAAWWMFDRLSDEPSGERLTHVEHRLVRAEAEILRLGAKALDTEYMKKFPEPYIPGSPLNRPAEPEADWRIGPDTSEPGCKCVVSGNLVNSAHCPIHGLPQNPSDPTAPREWMPDCTCGRDPKFFRHDSQCPLRYWYELRALNRNGE